MPRKHKIKLELDGFAAARPSDLKAVQKSTWKFLGKFWHRTYKAIKFTKRGSTKYGFAPRSGMPGSGKAFRGSYSEAKLLRKPFFRNSDSGLPIGEVKPNVWSGRSRSEAMSNQIVHATARKSGQGRVDIIISGNKLNIHNPASKTRPKHDVTSIVSSELREMERVGAKRFAKELLRVRRRKTVKS